LPIPAGIGAVEGGLIGALVLYGAPAAPAAAAVLLYRGVSLLIAVPLGVLGWAPQPLAKLCSLLGRVGLTTAAHARSDASRPHRRDRRARPGGWVRERPDAPGHRRVSGTLSSARPTPAPRAIAVNLETPTTTAQ
jgi:hypothetical protein